MDERDHFYMTFVSSLSTEEHQDNTPSHFITPLPKPLELNKNEWEVGLAEISFPHNWCNHLNEEGWVSVYGQNNRTVLERFHIPGGYYKNFQLFQDIF